MTTDALPQRKIRWGRMIAWTVLMIAIGVMGLVLVRSFAGPADAGPAPDFTLTTYSGETYSLDELEGQVIVLNFWASWCAPCAEEAPDLEATWQAYRDQGVVVLGVGWVDTEANALGFIEEYGITYPNGPDLRSRIADAFGLRGVPETYIIDRTGQVIYHSEGTVTADELSRQIERALR